jgi:hypothetical protein
MRVRFPNFVPTARKNDKVHLELMGHLKTWKVLDVVKLLKIGARTSLEGCIRGAYGAFKNVESLLCSCAGLPKPLHFGTKSSIAITPLGINRLENCGSLRTSQLQNRLQCPPEATLSLSQVIQFETFVEWACPVNPLGLHQVLGPTYQRQGEPGPTKPKVEP